MRHTCLSDEVKTIPLVQVVDGTNSEDRRRRGIHEKIYGKTLRREAIAKLRDNATGNRSRTPLVEPQHCCALQDVIVNQAAKIHEQLVGGSLQVLRSKIAPDNQNATMVRLDVENVRSCPGTARHTNGVKNKAKYNNVASRHAHASDPRTAHNSHGDADEGMKSDVNRIRGYIDLLDEYSLHHFVIWQGQAIRDTPEFTSLARTHQMGWSSINRCVSILEEIMTANAVPLAVIDGKQLSDLAKFDLERVDEADLCSCIANLEQIRPLLRHTRFVLHNPSAAQLAAITIQAAVRRFLERSGFLLLKRQRSAASTLQCLARGRSSRRLVNALLIGRRREAESKWQALQAGLRKNWESWRDGERVIILVPFASNGEHAYTIQTSRMHWLVDPKVHVICVMSSHPEENVVEYNRKLLEMAGSHDARGRMTVVVPENVDLFQNRLPLASLLLYSPGCLKRITHIVKGRPALILSGNVGWQDKRLAVALEVPLLSAEPSLAVLLQTQSGMKRVFAAADVSAPIGAHDVYDEEDLMIALTKLIVGNLEVQRWHIKVDVCRGNRGLAVLDTSTLVCMASLKREKGQLERGNGGSSGVWHHPDVQLLARAKLLKNLRRCLHRVICICNSSQYPTWTLFLGHLGRVGGVIEAEAPTERSHLSANVFISPTGKTTFLSEAEILSDACYQHVGCVYPQECVSEQALRGASAAVSRQLCLRGVIGYATIYFVVYWNELKKAPRLWATGLEFGLTVSASSFCLFRSLTKTPRRGQDFGCYEESFDGGDLYQGQFKRYVYLDHVQHPSLRSIRVPVFFKLCRLDGISFDLGTQAGTIFNLVDNLTCGMIGVLAIAESRQTSLDKALGALKFVRRMAKERFVPSPSLEEPLAKEMRSIGQAVQRGRIIEQERLHRGHGKIG